MTDKIYTIRQACVQDIDFVADVIVAAEKSMTTNFGLARLFNMSEEEVRLCLIQILGEDVDGCEFSLSSFYIACYQDKPVAAMGGWLEGCNGDGMPSALLKANLINYAFPREKVLSAVDKQKIVRDLQIERELGTYQLEYSYTMPEHRGNGLINKIIDKHIERAQAVSPNCSKAQVHVFENNLVAIRMYERSGFKVAKKYVSKHPLALEYFPDNVELLMEKELIY